MSAAWAGAGWVAAGDADQGDEACRPVCDGEGVGGADGEVRQRDLAGDVQGDGERSAAGVCEERGGRAAVLKFFAAQGITPPEISVGQIQVTDKQANEYGGNNNGGPRYIVQQTVTVSSNDVDKISKAGQKTAQLLQAGIIVVGGYGQGIRYVFNGLNALKPDMITEATKNARASADRFAADSGSQVGSIRSANQGVFSISAADAGSGMAPGEEGGGGVRRRIRMRAS